MPGSRSRRAAGAAVVLAAALGTSAATPATSTGDADVRSTVLLRFADDRIEESSGLAVRGDRLLTVNDSGDGPYVYEVDVRTGATVSVRTYDDADPTDVEALAPGPGRSSWVGDIGDNTRMRDEVVVHRLSPGGGTELFVLRYPDGPHDAEALLVHPRTGRLFVVTKVPFLGGAVYAAPGSLDTGQVNPMREAAAAPGTVTDGAFFPDGRHVVLRSYGSATVHRFPGFEPIGSFDLPVQEQGEGVAVRDATTLLLSSEGIGSEVLEVPLPPDLARAMRAPETSPAPAPDTSAPEPPEPAAPGEDDGEDGAQDDGAGWRGYAVAGAAAVLLVGLVLRAARRRGRRRP